MCIMVRGVGRGYNIVRCTFSVNESEGIICLLIEVRFRVEGESTVRFLERSWVLSLIWLGVVLLLILVVVSLLLVVFRYQCWWYEFE